MHKALQVIAAGIAPSVSKDLSPPSSNGWNSLIVREPYSGAWQRNEELTADSALAYHAVFACHTLICSDVAKLRVKLVEKKQDVWQEVTNPAYSPVLRKPNGYQTRVQFFESWVNSKLARGNTYVLKRRDGRNVVTGLYVLNPDRVQPLVSDDGQVFYQLHKDNLSEQQADSIIVPQREIIHDRFNCLFHPLVGISPLFAAALPATQGVNIQRSNSRLAANGVRPGGIITFPNRIPPEDAARIKESWETQYSGAAGRERLAVLGEGAKFEALAMTSEEAELIEQLKWSAQMVCSAYHVPPYKIGVGDLPSYNNVQALNVEYYSQCLQKHLEDIEACLDEGLGMDGVTIGTEFDTDNLLRMDSITLMDMLEKSKGKLTVNEQRAKLDRPSVTGGDTVYLQEQDHSLEWLSKRDSMPIEPPAPAPTAPPEPANDDAETEREAAKMLAAVAKGLA